MTASETMQAACELATIGFTGLFVACLIFVLNDFLGQCREILKKGKDDE